MALRFEVHRPDIDETQHPHETPHDYVRRLSLHKAKAVAGTLSGDVVVLAADTIVVDSDSSGVTTLLGKPADAAAATALLQRLRARWHRVCTGFTVVQHVVNTAGHGDEPGSSQPYTQVVCTRVHMRNYTDAQIAAYIVTGDPYDKAGGYAIQHDGFHPVEHIDGDYNNVVGLPLDAVLHALARYGILPPD